LNGLILIDSDILIDAAKKVENAIMCLDALCKSSSPAVSIITAMELMVGSRNKIEQKNTERFLAKFNILHVNEGISQAAFDLIRTYRLSNGLLMADAIIAATAMNYDIPFISKNQRDYKYIKGLHLNNYPL
jgi:predicted nucleic acid-binding protein